MTFDGSSVKKTARLFLAQMEAKRLERFEKKNVLYNGLFRLFFDEEANKKPRKETFNPFDGTP